MNEPISRYFSAELLLCSVDHSFTKVISIMAIVSKTDHLKPTPITTSAKATDSTATPLKLEPRLQRARDLMAKGEYQEALRALPAVGSDIEIRNISAVCLLRQHRFAGACDLLRTVCLNSQVNRVREDVPDHIRVNYAIALFFGGQPAGGLEVLQEMNREDDPDVRMLREQAKLWVAGMSFFKRLDWRLNRVAPKSLPVPPAIPLGRCFWDLA